MERIQEIKDEAKPDEGSMENSEVSKSEAIPTGVAIAEILKSNEPAVEKYFSTSTVCSMDDTKGRLLQKARIEEEAKPDEGLEKSEATPTDDAIAEILKSNEPAIEKPGSKDDTKGRLVQKAKVEILLGKTQELTTNVAAMEPVTEKLKLTDTAVETPLTENSEELTTNSAAMEPGTENFNKLTSTPVETPVTENSQGLTTNTAAVAESSNEVTNTAAEAPKEDTEKK